MGRGARERGGGEGERERVRERERERMIEGEEREIESEKERDSERMIPPPWILRTLLPTSMKMMHTATHLHRYDMAYHGFCW